MSASIQGLPWRHRGVGVRVLACTNVLYPLDATDGPDRPNRAGELEDGQIEVFLTDPDRLDPAYVEAARAVLDVAERAQAEKFRFASDRTAYIAAHALLRSVLAHYTGQPAASLELYRTRAGRPELLTPARGHGAGTWRGRRSLRFSLSHTVGLVGCAVTSVADIGFDLERARSDGPVDLAERFLAPAEIASLRAAPPGERNERFYALWTLKEAYLKARGLGLQFALDSFVVSLDGDSRWVLAGGGKSAADWTLTSFRVGAHAAGIAVRHRNADALGARDPEQDAGEARAHDAARNEPATYDAQVSDLDRAR